MVEPPCHTKPKVACEKVPCGRAAEIHSRAREEAVVPTEDVLSCGHVGLCVRVQIQAVHLQPHLPVVESESSNLGVVFVGDLVFFVGDFLSGLGCFMGETETAFYGDIDFFGLL